MDTASAYFIPPLLASVATEHIAFGYAGAIVHTVTPIRSAKTGQLSIYGSPDDSFSRVVIAVSFEEDGLPVLSRQVYYHYLEGEDSIAITDSQVAFYFSNNNPSTQPDVYQDEYQKTVVWRVNFTPNALGAVRSLLEMINTAGHWRQLAPISSLPIDEQSPVYYNLRATLIEQPIPPRLGALGHWQSRLPGGTPSHMPYMEGQYRATNISLDTRAQQNVVTEEERRVRELRATSRPPLWGQGAVVELDASMSELGADNSQVVKDSMPNTPAASKQKRMPEKEHVIFSPFSEEGSPSRKGHSGKGKQKQQQELVRDIVSDSLLARFSDNNLSAESRSIEQKRKFVNQLQTFAHNMSVPQSSIGSPALPIRTKRPQPQHERKVSMDASVDLGGGKKADVQLVMPENTAR